MPLPEIIQTPALLQAGLRHGSKGTHTTRTSMQTELNEVMEGVPAFATREDYQRAIVDENLLGKRSTSNRILSNQRLGELYGLDRGLLLFRVLRHLWSADPASRPCWYRRYEFPARRRAQRIGSAGANAFGFGSSRRGDSHGERHQSHAAQC